MMALTDVSNAEVFWSGVVIGAVVMAALISMAQSVAAEMKRLQDREHERVSALPRRRW